SSNTCSHNGLEERALSSPAWTDEKLHRIEKALPARYKILVRLCAGLGLRIGEALAFSPDQIDRKKMVYECTRQLVYRNGILYFKLPKGHKTRSVPIGDGVLQSIDEYLGQYPAVKITLPWAERDNQKTETARLLLTTERNGAWRASMFGDDVWRPAFAAAGLNYVDRKDGTQAMRHLFASHTLSQGVSIKELADYLGHSSEAFTLRTYVHLMPTSHTRARQAINNLFHPRLDPAVSQDLDVNAATPVGPTSAQRVA
ncbi:tyrosine-type recombinase/integrase, partial [Kutzneria buriramensis]